MTAEINSPVSQELRTDLQLDQRTEIINDWLDAACYVADQSGSPEVIELLEFFEDRIAIGVPGNEEGFVNCYYWSEPGDRDPADFIYLTPLLHLDADRMLPHDERQGFISGDTVQAARFAIGSHALYLPYKGIEGSQILKGLLLIHEMMHAKNLFQGDFYDPDTGQDDAMYWLEEASVYAMEIDLLGKLAGKAYSRHIDYYVRGVLKEYEQTGLFNVKVWFEPRILNKIAKRIGMNESDFDRNMFFMIAYLDVARKTFMITHPDEWMQVFADLLSTHPTDIEET